MYKNMTKKDLEDEVLLLKLQIAKADDAVNDLRTYLLSEKFHNDSRVETHDVLRYLENVKLWP